MQATEESIGEAAKRSVPLKAMVFVDGTWLYYSFFGRYHDSTNEQIAVQWSINLEPYHTSLTRGSGSLSLLPIVN